MSKRRLETRARILEAARSVVEDSGGSGWRLEDVARAAGLSRQAVYVHFGSRSGLLLGLVQYVDELADIPTRARDVAAATTAEEELEGFVRMQADLNPRIQTVARALERSRHEDTAARAAWEDRITDRLAACRRIVARLEKAGQLHHEWSPSQATELMLSLTSLRNWEDLVIERGLSADDYVRIVHRALRRALIVDEA